MSKRDAMRDMAAAAVYRPDPERAFALAQELIAIPSFKGEEAALAEWLETRLGELGFETELQRLTGTQAQVIARAPGDHARPTLMLNGHLDIDPLRSNWSHDPFDARLEGDLLFGAGVRNMQGGLVSILLAAESLLGQRDRANLTVALVAGELQGGLGTRHALEHGLTADLAIVPEPFGVDALVTDTWGVIEFAIVLEGLSTHVSKPHLARDPLPIGIELREALLEQVPALLGLQQGSDEVMWNIGGFVAGRGDDYSLNAANYSPDRCALLIDVRHSDARGAQTIIDAFTTITEAFDRRSGETGVTARLQRGSTQAYRLNEIDFPAHRAQHPAALTAFLQRTREETLGAAFAHAGTVIPHSYCGADTAHLGRAGIPSVLVGPTGPQATPGVGDDAVHFSEVLDTARYLYAVGVDLDWHHLRHAP
jgi:acetylornithine deacetylase